MIVINLVLFIGLVLLARDLQSLVGNGFNDFCVHRTLVKGKGVRLRLYWTPTKNCDKKSALRCRETHLAKHLFE